MKIQLEIGRDYNEEREFQSFGVHRRDRKGDEYVQHEVDVKLLRKEERTDRKENRWKSARMRNKQSK